MKDYTESELLDLRKKVVEQINISRKTCILVHSHNADLRMLCLRQTGRLLLSLDLLDAHLAERRQELITPYWIPKL